MDITFILIVWSFVGAFAFQQTVLRKQFKEPPRFYVTWIDCIKSIPFGPIPMLAVFGAWIWFKFFYKKILKRLDNC